MILLDTNIISTFSKIGKFELLYDIFNKEILYISPNVFEELKKAKDKGYSFVDRIFYLILKKKLQIISLNQEEILKTINIPNSLAAGEKDSIILCKERNGIFITNEKKVINYCKKEKINYFDLIDILKAMYDLMDYSKEKIISLINKIERKDNIIIRNKEEIFN